jgi:hypothetical protein
VTYWCGGVREVNGPASIPLALWVHDLEHAKAACALAVDVPRRAPYSVG